MAELRKANKLYKEKIAEEKRVQQAREKEEPHYYRYLLGRFSALRAQTQ